MLNENINRKSRDTAILLTALAMFITKAPNKNGSSDQKFTFLTSVCWK